MSTSIHYWAGSLGWLLLSLNLISVAGLIVRFTIEKKAIEHGYTNTTASIRKIVARVEGTMPKVAVALFFTVLGFGANDVWRFHHTYVLTNLEVIAKPGDSIVRGSGASEVIEATTYWLQREDEPRGQAFPFQFCHDYVPEMQVGDHIEVVVYEAKFNPGCHDVGGGGKNGIIFHPRSK